MTRYVGSGDSKNINQSSLSATTAEERVNVLPAPSEKVVNCYVDIAASERKDCGTSTCVIFL